MKDEQIIIQPTIWLPLLILTVLAGFAFGMGFGDGLWEDESEVRTVADDCLSDLLVKQQTGQIGRYGTVHGLGENAPLTRAVLKSICEDAWSIDGPKHSPPPFDCPEGLRIADMRSGEETRDPDCATPGTTAVPTIDASPTVQTPTPIPNTATPTPITGTPTPTKTAGTLPETGGRP